MSVKESGASSSGTWAASQSVTLAWWIPSGAMDTPRDANRCSAAPPDALRGPALLLQPVASEV